MDTNIEDSLDKLILLRNEVYENSLEFYHKWEPFMHDSDFKNSAL